MIREEKAERFYYKMFGKIVEYSNGNKYWYLNGKLHREDSPAAEHSSGYKAWYLNGKRHRKDGPAVEYSNGCKAWYLNGREYTEEKYWRKIKGLNGCGKKLKKGEKR